MSEMLIELDPKSPRSREEQLNEIRTAMENIPEFVTAVEQPIAHLISHMLSGVKAQVGIKIYGDDLDLLRQKAEAVKAKMQNVPGVTDLLIEPQVIIPQLRIELNRAALTQYGISAAKVNDYVQTAMNGAVVSEVLDGMRTFDLVVRMKDEVREDIEGLKRLAIHLPEGGTVPLGSLANIYESGGPNTVNRENVRRRVVIQCNVKDRGVVDVVKDIQTAIQPVVATLPAGYYPTYEGQFQSQKSASQMIASCSPLLSSEYSWFSTRCSDRSIWRCKSWQRYRWLLLARLRRSSGQVKRSRSRPWLDLSLSQVLRRVTECCCCNITYT